MPNETPRVPTAEVPLWKTAVDAAESKKATDLVVLDLQEVTSFTDHFVICTGSNARQIQAIADAVGEETSKLGHRALSVEGYQNAEWILCDYGDFIVHVLSGSARTYYDLERLWRHAKRVNVS
jgi:ribosome-associated protein